MSSPFKPGITVAVMVRDDAERLDRCLTSCRPLNPTFVVLDTGSKDNTVDVAKKHGATVKEIKWPGAFDVALNQLLDMVETEWTLRLDSDEWLPAESAEAISQVIQNPTIRVVTLNRVDLHADGSSQQFSQPRLFRTDPRLRYVGAIHEQLPAVVVREYAENQGFGDSGIPFLHDGFQAEGAMESKLRRNLPLLRAEVEKNPEDIFYEVCLADTLQDLKDPEAEDVRLHIVDRYLRKPNSAPDSHMVAITMTKHLEQLKDEDLHTPRIGKLLRYMLQWFAPFPAVLWAVADVERKRGNPRNSLEVLLQLDKIGASRRFSPLLPFNPAMVGPACWHSIIQVAQQLGRDDLIGLYQRKMHQAQRQVNEARAAGRH